MSSAATVESAPAAERQPAAPGPPSPWREWVMIGAAVLTPPLAYLSNGSLAVLVALGGVLTLPLLLRDRRPMLGLAFLVGLAVWAMASMSWSVFRQPPGTPSVSIEDLTGVKMLFEIGFYGAFVSAALGVSEAGARRAGLTLAIGVCLLAALFMVEGLSQASIYFWIREQVGQPTDTGLAIRDVSRVAYALALLFWPAAIVLESLKLRWAAVAVALAMVSSAVLMGADAPFAALAVSTAVFFLVRWKGRVMIWTCLGACTLYFVAAPLLAHLASPDLIKGLARESWAARLDIWHFAAERILERPFFGWGLDASRMFSPHIQLHTHNGALQLWLELGAVGVSLAALFWAWLFGRIDRIETLDRPMAAAAAATATVYLMIGALSFGVWQEWWVALGAVAAAFCGLGVIGRRAAQAALPTVGSSAP
jgi:O-antigen ligase